MKGKKVMKNLIKSPFFERPFGSFIEKVFDNIEPDDWYRGLITKTNGQVNISEGKDGYTIEVSAPGFTKEELNIKIDNNVLIISGEHTTEQDSSSENYTRKEFSKQSFERSFKIPNDVEGDGFDAKFENGILIFSMKKPKEQPKPDPKKIEIK